MVFTVLAFDVSSKSTGYAVFIDGLLQKDLVGLIQLKHETHGERLTIFEEEVLKLLVLHNPDSVVVEEIWKGPSVKTFKVLSYYHGIIQKILFKWKQMSPIMLMPTEARQIVGSKYKVVLIPKRKKGKKPKKDSKELTFDFIKKMYKFVAYEFKKDNDRTDAICLGLALTIMNEDKNGSV